MPAPFRSRAKALDTASVISIRLTHGVSIAPACSALALALVVFAALALAALPAAAQPGSKSGSMSSAATAATTKVQPSKPLWRELSSRQQRALEPLASTWDELTEPHKRKWLAISRDYAKLSPSEQEMLHSRMTEWARLSNQEREQARLNFAAVKQVPPDERKAKWEAYQALSEEEKRKLAARAATVRTPGAAPVTHPSTAVAQKFAPVPALALDSQHQPRIQLAPPAAAEATRATTTNKPTSTAPPVPAEAEVLAPSSSSSASPSADAPTAPAVRLTERPASAP